MSLRLPPPPKMYLSKGITLAFQYRSVRNSFPFQKTQLINLFFTLFVTIILINFRYHFEVLSPYNFSYSCQISSKSAPNFFNYLRFCHIFYPCDLDL